MIYPMSLSGKNILVTGASSGIGRGIAVFLSQMGANVIMVARNEDRLKEVCQELTPGNHCYHIKDLSDIYGIKGLMERICKDGLKLHGLVHAAGISKTMPLLYSKISDVENIMRVNFYSFLELVKHFSNRKYNDNGGSIVAISSISSRVGAKGLSAYCASKGALESAIRAMALELAPKKIRINSVAPGMIETKIYSDLKQLVDNKDFEANLIKRQIMGIGKPEDVAYATAFLLSDAARFITGTTICVDGGYLAH